MKILFTTPTYPPFNSGLGNAVQQQVLALTSRGCAVTVATSGDSRGTRTDVATGASIEEFNIHGAESFLQPIRGDVDDYVRFLTDSRYDAVIMNAWQTWSTDLALKNIRNISGRKYLYSNCVSTNLFMLNQPIRSAIKYMAWRPYWFGMARRMTTLDGMIFVSDRGCDSRFDDLKLAQDLKIPFVVIPNSISDFAIDSSDDKEGHTTKRTQIIAVGSYDWFKGHDFALRAYARSVANNHIPFKIFGPHFTTYTDRLRKLATDLGLSPKQVTFHEKTSKDCLVKEYRKAKLLISGSHTECQPLVLLDAMATGTPYVARACGCIPFLQGGITVKTHAEATCAIDHVLGNSFEWARISREGLLAAHSKYHPEVVGEGLMAFILSQQ